MICTVKLFARARDLVGQGETTVELRDGASVAELRRALTDAHPELGALLERCAVAVNNDFAADEQSITAGAEIAILPPVSGGAAQ